MNTKSALMLSILGNLILAIMLISGNPGSGNSSKSAGDTQNPVENNSQAADNSKADASDGSDGDAEAGSGGNDTEVSFDWQMVESEDYLSYIENLRKIGCPEETIKDIIKADVEKLFKQRRADFQKNLPPPEYWKASAMMGLGYSKEELDHWKALQKEQNATLKTLLGSSYKPEPANLAMSVMTDPEMMITRSIGFLSEDKRSQVYQAMMGMQSEIMEKAADDAGGFDGSMMADVQRNLDAKLSEFLSPEEKFEVDLRLSNASQSMKFQLREFDPSEEEFRSLFAAQQKLEKEMGVSQFDLMQGDRDAQKRYSELQQEFKDVSKEILGDQRYQEYEMSQDYNFTELNKIAKRNGLDRSNAVQAWEIQKAANEAAQQIRSNSDLTPEARNQAQMAIYEETSSALKGALGDTGFDNYNKSHAAGWLDQLKVDNSIGKIISDAPSAASEQPIGLQGSPDPDLE